MENNTTETPDGPAIPCTALFDIFCDDYGLAEELGNLKRESARLRKWIEELDVLVENTGEHREWPGSEIGWLYPGCAAYYARLRREDILSNEKVTNPDPTKI
jgi:hypothetical protein